MNEAVPPYRSRTLPMTTLAAEGLPRRRWSVAEIEAMVVAGILLEDERFELLHGEVVPMSPKGYRHELLKAALNKFWLQRLPDGVELIPETTFRFNEDTFVEPDFVFYRSEDGLAKLSPKSALLAVEVSDSSLTYDLGRKAKLYASFGIAEVWVINAVKLNCRVHRKPAEDGYSEILDVAPDAPLAPAFAPGWKTVLAALTLV